ncbi:MAG: prepilin-type N-terminal cleavage/methylation domain-containing protein [Planctomycetota bacterium]|nr:prepilin-type N-terminal cleavage/methylation domain-containing protein [Planctomycetota bacterium]
MRRAFSLIEVIVAVVIIAVLSAMIVPRISRTTKAEHENAVEKMSDLLSMFAFRDATSSQQIALWQDPETGWFAMLTKDRDPLATSEDGEGSKYEWATDIRLAPVVLPRGLELVDLSIDGVEVLGSDWLIPSIPGGGRPSIEMHFLSGSIDTVLQLDSNSMVPTRFDAGGNSVQNREILDLDQYGSRDEKW